MIVYCDNERCAWCYDGECHRKEIYVEMLDFDTYSTCQSAEEGEDYE